MPFGFVIDIHDYLKVYKTMSQKVNFLIKEEEIDSIEACPKRYESSKFIPSHKKIQTIKKTL